MSFQLLFLLLQQEDTLRTTVAAEITRSIFNHVLFIKRIRMPESNLQLLIKNGNNLKLLVVGLLPACTHILYLLMRLWRK